MPKTSTSFKPGNPYRVQPGNQLARKHGAYGLGDYEARYPALRARLEADLAENPLPAYRVDDAQKRRWVFLNAQAEAIADYYEARGGFFTASGKPKAGVATYHTIVAAIDKLERAMGIGNLARAQTIQAAAKGQRDLAQVRTGLKELHAELTA